MREVQRCVGAEEEEDGFVLPARSGVERTRSGVYGCEG